MAAAQAQRSLGVLLVSASRDEARGIERVLTAAGIQAAHVMTVVAAAEALQGGGFDALVLSHPLPDAELIGSCATLAGVPGAPPILLLDALDRRDELARTLPEDLRPARSLVKPIDAAKLPALLHALVSGNDPAEPDPRVDRAGLAHVLLDLAHRSETGALEVRGEGPATRVYFRSGAPVSVEGGSLRETLGRLLVRGGALSEADYQKVIRRMTERVIDNEHQRMGEVLVELGLMTTADVYAALSQQGAEKIRACFQFPRVELVFHEMTELQAGIEPLALPSVPALLIGALREHASEAELEALLAPHALLRLAPREDATRLCQRLRLQGDALRIIALFNGRRSVREIASSDPGLRAAIVVLLLADVLGPADAPARAGAPPPRATREAAQFTKDVVRVAKAGPPPASQALDESKARLEAEKLFQRARQLVERNKFADAHEAMLKAVELRPLEPEYRMYEAWASYLNACVVKRVARAKAIACSRRLLETDPRAGKPHTILGRLLLDDGDLKSAEKEFQIAITRDPEDEEAIKGLHAARGIK